MARSEALVLELDVDAPGAPAEVLALARQGAARQWRQLGPDSRRLLLALQRTGVEPDQARSLAPAMWLMQLTLNEYQRLGQATQEGSETMLLQMARGGSAPAGVGDDRRAGRMLFEMPAAALREWVRQTAEWQDKPEAERYYRDLIAAWERGDLPALQSMVALPGYPRLSA